MKKIFTLLLFTAIFPLSAQTARYVQNHLIVKLDKEAYGQTAIDMDNVHFGIAAFDNLNSEIGLSKISPIGQHIYTRTFLLEFNHSIDAEALAIRYKNLGIFEYTVPNRIGSAGGQESEIIPNDTRFNRQWSFYNTGAGQSGVGPLTPVADADVDMDLAWDVQTGDPDMIIAAIDGGTRLTHPDFASRIWTNSAEIPGNGIDDDSNGLVDDVNGWDFFFNDNDPTDERGHGTNVGGIIGAVANNNNLYVGANWNSKIMILKCIDYDLNATYASVANSVYYAVDNGAKILNMSLGFNPASTILEDFVTYAENHNVLITAAMMNFNNNINYYPAGYSLTHPNVIACGSTSPNDYRTAPFDWSATSGSNFGTHINVVAPGIYIYNLTYYSDTVFTVYWSGTSMATPLVASIASLVWAEAPNLTPGQVRSVIENSAQDQVGNPTEDTAGFDVYMGHGRANANDAVLAAQLLARSEFGTSQAQEFEIINPVKGNAFEVFSKGQFPGNYEWIVTSMDGKQLQSETLSIKVGANSIPFEYPKGNYIVTLKSDAYRKIFKVLKE
jgi:thermitase